MKLHKWFLAALAAGNLAFGMLQPAQADEQGWGLMVKSPHVGYLYLYITNEGFAIVIKETGAKFVTHAPDWRVVMYNDKSQVYYVERLSDLSSITHTSKAKQGQQLLKNATGGLRVGETGTVGGLPATQYFATTVSPEGARREAEVWITKSIIPPKQLHDMLQKIFSIQTADFPPGLPLRIRMSDDTGKRELVYDTLNAQRQLIHTASFTYPPTYKRVDSELAVLMDEKSRKKMESILDDSDDLSSILGSDTPKSSSTTPHYPSVTPYRPAAQTNTGYRPATPAYRATTTGAQQKKPTQGSDAWWSNMMNAIGGSK